MLWLILKLIGALSFFLVLLQTQIVSDETWKLVDDIWDKKVQNIKDEASKVIEEEKEKPQLLMASHFLWEELKFDLQVCWPFIVFQFQFSLVFLILVLVVVSNGSLLSNNLVSLGLLGEQFQKIIGFFFQCFKVNHFSTARVSIYHKHQLNIRDKSYGRSNCVGISY